jgi:uncharacterized protein
MRIGLVSDIHGNHRALRRALHILGNVDQIFCLGDSINQFGFSNEVVHMLRERGAHTIWGNHEAIFFSPLGENARRCNSPNPELLGWLSQRPVTMERQVLGLNILLVHSTPSNPLGNYVGASTPSYDQQFSNLTAHIAVCGHTHQPSIKRIGQTLVINPGSVGEGRPEASGYVSSCAILEATSGDCQILDFTLDPD